MIGFIYHITNKINGKKYIGQTVDIEHRIKRHFLELQKGEHHSTKLQRAFDKYGKDNFEIEYSQKQFKTYEDLLIAQKEEIDKFNSYENGYNQTRGGEGHSTLFDFETLVLLYQIGKRYDGIKHKIAEYYHCDRTSITAVFRKEYLNLMSFDQNKVQQLIKKIGITQNNLKENYKNNYSRKLTTEDVLKILSTMEIKKYSGSACGKVFGVDKDIVSSIVRGKTYKKDYQKFLSLTLEEKGKLAEQMCNTTDVIRLHYQGQRGAVKNPLTQEQVNYILDNINKKTITEISKELKISVDRVRNVRDRKSYLDMIWVYNKIHNS